MNKFVAILRRDHGGMIFHTDPRMVERERLSHASQCADFVSFDIHTDHIDILNLFFLEEIVQRHDGNVECLYAIGSGSHAADIGMCGDIEGQGAVDIADTDIM